jgi:hypothetical protein
MPKSFRRFELLLPTQFNDDRPVPEEAFADSLLELEHRFGAVSAETQIIQGQWRHLGELHRDKLIRVFVDVPDTLENRQFFVDFKERLKERFQQIDIWMTTHPLDVI